METDFPATFEEWAKNSGILKASGEYSFEDLRVAWSAGKLAGAEAGRIYRSGRRETDG